MDKRKRVFRILVFALVTVVSLCLLYYICDMPSFSAEMAMHRKEAAQLVGPSRVIAADQVNYYYLDHILLGETDDGYCLLEYSDVDGWDNGVFAYREKGDVITCFSSDVGYVWVDSFGEKTFMPVFVIPEMTRTTSARLTLSAVYDGTQYQVSQTVPLRQGEFFLFEMDVTELHSYVRYFWIDRLKGIQSTVTFVSGTATVELFDRHGELIETVVMEFPATM